MSGQKTIAFLFLTVRNHKQSDLWFEFFESHADQYKAYLHAKHRDSILDPWWRRFLIEKYVPTSWGKISIVRAVMALLEAALKEPGNERFVLVSDSCVPIKPFSVIRDTLFAEKRGRMSWQKAADMANQRRAMRMHLAIGIAKENWIYHEQWIALTREIAEWFVDHDRTWAFEQVSVPDECYFGSILSSAGFDLETTVLNTPLTHTDWLSPRKIMSGPYVYEKMNSLELAKLKQSECLIARKFSAESDIKKYNLHIMSGSP